MTLCLPRFLSIILFISHTRYFVGIPILRRTWFVRDQPHKGPRKFAATGKYLVAGRVIRNGSSRRILEISAASVGGFEAYDI